VTLPFNLTAEFTGKGKPEKFGPYAYPAPDTVGGFRLTPEGLAHAHAFCAKYRPLAKLALHAAQTKNLALRCLTEHGPEELESLCGIAVLDAVRCWEPDRAGHLSTVVGWQMFSQLTRLYDTRRPPGHRGRPVFTNCYSPDADGVMRSDLDLEPAPGGGPAEAGHPADELRALVRRARRLGFPLTPREKHWLYEHVGKRRTLRELAAEGGRTKERVRQVTALALGKLRAAAGLLAEPPVHRNLKPAVGKSRHPTNRRCPACGAAPRRRCAPAGEPVQAYCGPRKLPRPD
jgi:hypothetical protein